MLTMTGPPNRKRRWFQFSLRMLMIGVTLFCVVVGGYLSSTPGQRWSPWLARAAVCHAGRSWSRSRRAWPGG